MIYLTNYCYSPKVGVIINKCTDLASVERIHVAVFPRSVWGGGISLREIYIRDDFF